MILCQDISSDFKFNYYDAKVAKKIVRLMDIKQDASNAIKCFCKNKKKLSDYGYWFFLSTMWVKNTDNTNINLWIKLFSSNRDNRLTSIMKPSELIEFRKLPERISVYRAHGTESNWISYSLDYMVAVKFALRKGVREIKEYECFRRDVLALFLRRNEKEIIVLDKNKVRYVSTIRIEKNG